MEEKSSKPRRIGNHYVPPPARTPGLELKTFSRLKERPLKPSNNREEKLCNDSSLLFKDSIDKPKQNKRKKKKSELVNVQNISLVPGASFDSPHANSASEKNTLSNSLFGSNQLLHSEPQLNLSLLQCLDSEHVNSSSSAELKTDLKEQSTDSGNNISQTEPPDSCKQLCIEPPSKSHFPDDELENDYSIHSSSGHVLTGPGDPPVTANSEVQEICPENNQNLSIKSEVADSDVLEICPENNGTLAEKSEIADSDVQEICPENNQNLSVDSEIADSGVQKICLEDNEILAVKSEIADSDLQEICLENNQILSLKSEIADSGFQEVCLENNQIVSLNNGTSCTGVDNENKSYSSNDGGHELITSTVNELSSSGSYKIQENFDESGVSTTGLISDDSSQISALRLLTIDDDDWESMYDDQGDCLVSETSSSVERTPETKDAFQLDSCCENMKTPNSRSHTENEEKSYESSSIIEIYGFSEDLKTNDLIMVFSNYIEKGFNLKWVDNTHALGVFPSTTLADEVLSRIIPLVKTRPISQGTTLSREKARTLILPSALRPKTCPASARRLVTGALGLRVKTTPEERAAERELLREAREKRKHVLKLRDAAWEGNFPSSDEC